MREYKTKLGQGGRIVIPAEYRESLSLRPGDEVLIRLEEEEVRILTRGRAVKRAQAVVRRYIPEGVELVDQLLADRLDEVDDA